MRVKAAVGLKVPKEQNPREYITPDTEEDIEVTAYYLRRLADNELVEVGDAQENPTAAAAKTSRSAK